MRAVGDGQAADARESSWGRCTWQVRLGYREAEDRDGLCVSICTAIGSPISAVYSRIKSYGK